MSKLPYIFSTLEEEAVALKKEVPLGVPAPEITNWKPWDQIRLMEFVFNSNIAWLRTLWPTTWPINVDAAVRLMCTPFASEEEWHVQSVLKALASKEVLVPLRSESSQHPELRLMLAIFKMLGHTATGVVLDPSGGPIHSAVFPLLTKTISISSLRQPEVEDPEPFV